jgi:hypothetical protein
MMVRASLAHLQPANPTCVSRGPGQVQCLGVPCKSSQPTVQGNITPASNLHTSMRDPEVDVLTVAEVPQGQW